MNDYTQDDFLTPLIEFLSNSVQDDFSPLELKFLNQVIKKLDFENLPDLIYSMFIDKDKNIVENVNRSMYMQRICDKDNLMNDDISNILKKTSLLIEKYIAKYTYSIGLEKGAIQIKDTFQKQFLAENYMYPEIETHIKNANVFWELEKEKVRNITNIEEVNDNLVQNKNEPYYINSVEILPKLYQSLLDYSPPLIENNPYFIESFCNQVVNPLHRTNWIGSQTELFYLLYLLYNKNEFYKKLNYIPVVAFKLFVFPKSKNPALHSIKTNYLNFIAKVTKGDNTQQYLESKQNRITAIYDSLLK